MNEKRKNRDKAIKYAKKWEKGYCEKKQKNIRIKRRGERVTRKNKENMYDYERWKETEVDTNSSTEMDS